MNDLTYKNSSTYLDNNKQFSQKQFITDLYSCETAIYTLKKRIEEIDKKIKEVDYVKPFSVTSWYDSTFYKEYSKIYKYRHPVKDYPDIPKKKKVFDFDKSFEISLTSIPLALMVAVALMIIFCFTNWSRGFENAVFWGTVLSIAFGYQMLLIIVSSIDKMDFSSKMKEYEAICEALDKENRKIDAENKEAKNKFKQQYDEWVKPKRAEYDEYVIKEKQKIKQKQTALQNEKDEAIRQLQNVEKTLTELYSLRINGVLCIHPNYQGLLPVSILYGYFDTGRCSVLEGHEGAYNLYEDEQIKGMIITQLSSVAKQLNNLNTTMYYVGQAVSRCEEQLKTLNSNMDSVLSSITSMGNSVVSSLDSIGTKVSRIETSSTRTEESVANAAYYSEVGAKISAVNTFYNIYRN